MADKRKKRSREAEQLPVNIKSAVAEEYKEPTEIDISKYDRTENLEMTNPAHKTMQMPKFTGKVEMTGTFERLADRKPAEQKTDKALEMTSIPVSELGTVGTAQEDDSDEPYSPDSFGKPAKSSRPTHISAEGSGESSGEHTHHHHHHHSSESSDEHTHHHHHSSESSDEHTHHHHHSSESSDEHTHHHHHSSESSGEHTHHHHHSSESSDEHTHHHRSSSSAEKAAAAVTAKPDKTEKKKKSKKPEVKPLKPLFRIANIVYPAAVFAVTAVMFIVLPRPETSETEQRALAKFPVFSADSLLSGEYTNGITEYFNDAVPFRDDLKRAAAQVRGLFGISGGKSGIDEISGPIAVITEESEPEEPVVITTTQPITTAPVSEDETETDEPEVTAAVTTTGAPETSAAPETTEAPAETTKNVNEIAEGVITNGQVVTKLSDGHWWGISLYGGGKGTAYAAALNVFREALGEDVTIYNMVVPTAGEYYLPDTYSAYSASHQKSIDSIASQLNGIVDVPASAALREHTDEPIYTRTDHHWQPLGAYYAAQCFAETAGVPFADISTMERVDVPGYMGTMYSFTESANLLSDPETFTYYKPASSYTTYYYDRAYNFDYQLPFFVPMPTNGSYSTFMGGDDKIVRIKTDAGTGRKLVVFKDSYGNAEIPFYFGSFDEIWVCDMRYFDLNAVEFVEFTGATDLLFTMCTFSAVGSNANHLQTILNNPVTGITEPLNR